MGEIFHVLVYSPENADLEKTLLARVHASYPSLRISPVALVLATKQNDPKVVFDNLIMKEPPLNVVELSAVVLRFDSFFGSITSELMGWMKSFNPALQFRS